MASKLDGKVAVVTGTSSGIGEAIPEARADGIASAVAYCVTRPERVSVDEILIRPTEQAH